jgi:archaemetzincin
MEAKSRSRKNVGKKTLNTMFSLRFYFLAILTFCQSKTSGLSPADLANKLGKNDFPMPAVQASDWLAQHPEKDQNLQAYMASKPNRPDAKRTTIYLQPIGSKDPELAGWLAKTAEYLRLVYHQPVVVRPWKTEDQLKWKGSRKSVFGHVQRSAPFLLDSVLRKELPSDALGLMAITSSDVYANPKGNYVFGLGSYRARVGVTSVFWFREGKVPPGKVLRRLLKTASHEFGHMLSISHCVHAVCTMNGTNSLHETDRKPNRFCSQCSSKLHWNLGFKPDTHYKELAAWFRKEGLVEDALLAMKDEKALKRK